MTKRTQLSFDEALELLNNDQKVRLPEWTGYWFRDPQDNSIKAFTRTGTIEAALLNTYEDRKDWESADGSLGYDWAILAAKTGKPVRRTGWNGKGMFIFIRPGDVLESQVIKLVKSLPDKVKWFLNKQNRPIHFTPYFCMYTADGTIVNGWLASQTDMLATDWEVAEEVH